MKEDIHRFGERLEGEARKIINESRISETDREDLRNFYRQLIADGISPGRIIKCLYTLKPVMVRIEKPLRNFTKEDMIDLIGNLERNNKLSEWTKRDYKIIIKKFFKWVRKTEKYPEEVKWIKATIKNGNNKLPEDILTEEDVRKLLETAYTPRDKAFILCLYESGCRIGEFLPIKIRNMFFDEYGCVIKVSGKTGDRRVRLVSSSLALTRWIENHPDKNNPKSYLWCKNPTKYNPKHANNHLTYQFICRFLKEIAKSQISRKESILTHSDMLGLLTWLIN